MIKVIEGDVLAQERGFIVHGCNCQGVMGGGVAWEVRNRFPAAYKEYMEAHEISGLKLGDIQIVNVGDDKYIVNAMTQFWYGTEKRHVDYEAVAECFESLSNVIIQSKVEHIPMYFPLIGAGLAGGNWEIISTIIDQVVPDSIEKILVKFKP